MNKRKTIIAVVCSLLALVGIAGGIAYGTSASRHTCNVYPVSDLAMTGYWGDNQSTYGEVRSDKVQTVYLSDTQQVTDIFVTQGQTVRKGDKLLSYDTTLSELEVNRKEIEIQQMGEELTSAKKRYNTLAGSKVYTVAAPIESVAPVLLTAPVKSPETGYRLVLLTGEAEEQLPDPEEEPEKPEPKIDDYGVVLTYACKSGKGTHDDPYLYVCANGVPFDEAFLREIGLIGDEAPEQGEEPEDPAPVYVVFGVTEDNRLDGKVLQAGGMCFTRKADNVSFIVFDASDYLGRAFGEPKPGGANMDGLTKLLENVEKLNTTQYTEDSVKALTAAIALARKVQAKSDATQADIDAAVAAVNAAVAALLKKTDLNPNGSTAPSNNTTPGNNTAPSNNTTPSNNTAPSNNTRPSNNTTPSNNSTTPSTTPVTPTGPSYAEIQAEKAELQQKIKDLDLNLRMAEVELKRMKQELSDGIVYAEMDGTIAAVSTADEAANSGEPIIKLAGGGGYFIQGTVSELDLDSVHVGQKVNITSWESGSSFTGTVHEVSQTPTDNAYFYGGGNMNVSYYPFTVLIDGSANLREYESVEMQLEREQTEEPSDAFYLEMPFVLQENGESFVFVADAEGKLEKRKVATGVTLWGSSIQILGGLTLEDTIAFPYGKDAIEGANAQLSTLDELYSW